MLGHARLNTTEIYTHIAIQKLIEVHRLTHPARLPEGEMGRIWTLSLISHHIRDGQPLGRFTTDRRRSTAIPSPFNGEKVRMRGGYARRNPTPARPRHQYQNKLRTVSRCTREMRGRLQRPARKARPAGKLSRMKHADRITFNPASNAADAPVSGGCASASRTCLTCWPQEYLEAEILADYP